jgi:Ni/Co efflux regulator RcnB
MRRTLIAAVAALTAVTGVAGTAMAQPHDNGHDHDNGRGGSYGHDNGHGGGHGHPDWRQGGRIERSDWNRGARVDWRHHHLRQPPRGYEWRQVDGNYVLAAAATGLIASIMVGGR